MLLAINIGNTNIHAGLFQGRRLARKFTFPTNRKNALADLKKALAGNAADDAVICSVVPQATRRVTAALRALLPAKPLLVSVSTVPMVSHYRMPASLGLDRLVNAYAALHLYGAPAIVVDLGTAITIDAVSKEGHYLGGLILPGLHTGLETLRRSTALLPKVRLEKPRACIARDTRQGMLSGLVYGGACMIDGLVGKIKVQIGAQARLVITGGDGAFIRRYTKERFVLDGDLTLKGLNLIHNSR